MFTWSLSPGLGGIWFTSDHFNFMMLGERKTLLMPSDANPSMGQESLLPMKDSCRLNLCRNMRGLPVDRVREVHPQTARKKRKTETFFYHQQGQPEGNGLHFSCPPPVAGRGGRDTLTWPPVKRACQKPLEFRSITSPKEGETRLCLTISRETQPCANWAGPLLNLDRHRPAEQQEGREGEMVRDAEGIGRVVGCEVIPSHRVFY